jgi:acyl carrier protein
MKKTLFEIIKELQYDNGLVVSETINDEDDLINDLGFDSLNLAELTVIIEDEYGVDIFEKKIIRKVYEIKELLNE